MIDNGNIWLGTSNEGAVCLLTKMANRHGLISGATGTGKTVSLQVLAEGFSRLGVPVFLSDVAGSLGGLAKPGEQNEHITARLNDCKAPSFSFEASPVAFWDVFGKCGTPVRTTVSHMGPLLMSRMLDLNETQTGVMHIIFRIADDEGLMLIDLKDLKAVLSYIGNKAGEYVLNYGNIAKASVGAIQRAIAILEDQGGNAFFGEPALDVADWFSVTEDNKGVINILEAGELYKKPALYASFMLWLLGAMFDMLPECGDLDKPKMVFFFDEAHLLFKNCDKTLMERIEQTVRLIRSKGVGVYFCTQNPFDIPESILNQLSARVQHGLRAFTPQMQKKVNGLVQTFRQNPAFDAEKAIMELKTGEALLSFLMEDGTPSIVQRATILPPQSAIGAISDTLRDTFVETATFKDKYAAPFDRESAYEMLSARFAAQGMPVTQVVRPLPQAPAAPSLTQSEAPAYAPVAFSIFNPATGQYEQQPLTQMATPQSANVSVPAAQPPVLVWDAQSGQYVPQAPAQTAPPIQVRTGATVTPLPAKPKKVQKAEKQEPTFAQQMLTSFTKSAVTSAGRDVGRTASRSILGIFGLNKR